MTRFILRRLAIIPFALLLVNFFGYAYAHQSRPLHAARTPYFFTILPPSEPLSESYVDYAQDAVRLNLGSIPGNQFFRKNWGRDLTSVGAVVWRASIASLGLLVLALSLSVPIGLLLGLRAVNTDPPGVSRWLTLLSTVGQAMPSFYAGSLLVLLVTYYVLWQGVGTKTIFTVHGFGWDRHLISPVLVLLLRPSVQIAQMTSGLLAGELGKRYVLTARSLGFPWALIRRRQALRNILVPTILTIGGSFRSLVGELILVEWLFGWPGLGHLLATTLIPSQISTSLGSPLFLDPPLVAAVLTSLATLFMLADLIASILVRVTDPRLRVPDENTGTAEGVSFPLGSARANWSLRLGILTIFLVMGLAIIGPRLAPHDPMQEHTIAQVGDKWIMPPYKAFTVPGFPLGSDSYGRDLFSRLLWAVRPTLVMVAIVALVRLLIGTGIGLVAGWSRGWVGRWLDTAIAGALALPVLAVSLATIAFLGVGPGLIIDVPLPGWLRADLPFIIGLSITGWGETARIVREQTRLAASRLYVKAAQALGVSDLRIILRHVLRQLMPLVWMLFALEISGTLMTTAGLGFLGYYIGGERWVETNTDFVAARISGMPELGQMLATARISLKEPWEMVAIGTLIFGVILGFNLLGLGLQQRLDLKQSRRDSLYTKLARRLSWWIESQVWLPLNDWVRRYPLRASVTGLLVAAIGGGVIWWRAQAGGPPRALEIVVKVPGGHLWSAERHDPHGTRWTEATGPTDPLVRWAFHLEQGEFSGGPVVAADGTVYITSEAGMLYALDPIGNLIWQASLPSNAVGAPGLSANGTIYATDKAGGVSAFTPEGEPLWRFEPESGGLAVAGPIVAPVGTIYYPGGGGLRAVSPEGVLLWETRVPHDYNVAPPQLSPEGEWLFWGNAILDAKDGTILELDMPIDASFKYLVGADGQTYLRVANDVMQWQVVPLVPQQDSQGQAPSVEIVRKANWDYRSFTLLAYTPLDGGVTPEQHIWLFYANLSGTRFIWLDMDGNVLGVMGYPREYPFTRSKVIALDRDSTAHLCGVRDALSSKPSIECLAFQPGAKEALWKVALEGERVKGGALVPRPGDVTGRLYVVTEYPVADEGFLYAIDDGQPSEPGVPSIP